MTSKQVIIFTIVITIALYIGMNIGQMVHGQNVTNTENDDCFKSNADFCGGAAYIPNNHNSNNIKSNDNSNSKHSTGKIRVVYDELGSYNGKGKVVIKNMDTGKTLVTHDLNFAKQRANQGDNCCVKVYTFDKSGTHNGDHLSIKVTGGGGSWTDDSGFYTYKKNLEMGIDLDEIGE